MFNPDRPIDKASDDLLHRRSFSEYLAKALVNYEDKRSIVTALYGKWGSGKSSIINMCLEHIDELAMSLPKKNRPIVVRFDPWNYADQNQLISQFFRTLSAALDRLDSSEKLSALGEKLDDYAGMLEPLTLIPEPSIAFLAIVADKATKFFSQQAKRAATQKKRDLAGIRKEIDDILELREGKLVIVIDDIDRLNSNEIRQVFQLVKQLADFQNTVYLLTFDREVVAESLDRAQEGFGKQYLEKIVQIPFEVPFASKYEIEQYFYSQLDSTKAVSTSQLQSSSRWELIVEAGFFDLFISLRDVTRFVNSFRFAHSALEEHLDLIDFIVITAIQVAEPGIYEAVRLSMPSLTNGKTVATRLESSTRTPDILDQAIESRSSQISEDQIRNLLNQIFPLMSKEIRLSSIAGLEGQYRRDERICSPDKFHLFFRLTLTPNEISSGKMRSIFESANDQNEFEEELIEIHRSGTLDVFLYQSQDYMDSRITNKRARSMVLALMKLGDQLMAPPWHLGVDFRRNRIIDIIHELTHRDAGITGRVNTYIDAIEQAEDSCSTVVASIMRLVNTDGKVIRPEDIVLLKSMACNQIQKLADDGGLNRHMFFSDVMRAWLEWSIDDGAEVKKFAEKMTYSPEDLAFFIEQLFRHDPLDRQDEQLSSAAEGMMLEHLARFIDLQLIHSAISGFRANKQFDSLPLDRQKVLNTFTDVLDRRKRSKDQ